MTSITRADGVVVAIARNGSGRIASTTTPRGQIVATYDQATGHLKTITAPGGVALAYGYDGSIATSETWSGTVAGSVGSAVDNNAWLTGRTINGESVSYQRDDDGRLVQAGALSLVPDPDTGLPSSATLGGVATTWGYNGFAELRNTRYSFNNSTLYQVEYTRDKLGRISRKLEIIGGITSTYDYSYDAVGRLKEVKLNGTTVESYTYDDNGNRKTAITATGNASATFDERDRLTEQGAATYTYTAEGELRTKTANGQTTTYTYDPLGALLSVALPDGRTIEYVIDGQNRRVGKRINGTLTQGFLYAGDQLVAELDGAGNVLSTFVYADGSVPAYMQQGGTTYRLVTDQVGSVRLVVNAATGQVVQRLDYDAFGNVTADTNPGFQPFGFAGGLYDRDTGLVRFGARDYDAATGRWTARDPIGFAGGQANLYAYTHGDPVNFTDLEGLTDVPSIISGPDTGAAAAGIGMWQTATSTVTYGLLPEIPVAAGAAPVAAVPAATTAGAVLSSAIVGLYIGWRIDTAYTWAFGDTIGEDLYDLFHPEMHEPAWDPQKEPGWEDGTCK
ncbi:MAG: RHS repeat-associated core domain-containing protein [Chloroflexia bacterium]